MDYEIRKTDSGSSTLLFTVSDRVLYNTAEGKFKVGILPAGGKVWLDVNIRPEKDKLFLGCLMKSFHFERRRDTGAYVLKNGATSELTKESSEALILLVGGLGKAQKELEKKPLKPTKK